MHYVHHYFKGNRWLFCCYSVEGAILFFITYKIQYFNIPLNVFIHEKISMRLKIAANLFSSACLSSLNTNFQPYAYPPQNGALHSTTHLSLVPLLKFIVTVADFLSLLLLNLHLFSLHKHPRHSPEQRGLLTVLKRRSVVGKFTVLNRQVCQQPLTFCTGN